MDRTERRGERVAAMRLSDDLGPGHTVVTLQPDSGLKYLSGDLYR